MSGNSWIDYDENGQRIFSIQPNGQNLGATRLWDMPSWTVLGDPEGNEFCVFPPED